MPLKAGSRRDGDGLADSMAKAMEAAFYKEWSEYMGGASLPTAIPYVELLFVAIAQGVVRHLVDNPDAFQIGEDDEHLHGGNIETIIPDGTLY